jgi:hypothetical protein
MFNLITVIVSIALAGLLATMGISYMSPDVGIRTIVGAKTTGAMVVVSQAMLSYRQANGIDPTVGVSATDHRWIDELEPYLPSGSMPEVAGLEWSYASLAGRNRICLSAGAIPLPEASFDAVVRSAGDNPSVFVAPSCASPAAAPATRENVTLVMVR